MNKLACLALSLIFSAPNVFAHVFYRDLLADNLNSKGQFRGTLNNNYGWVDGADIAANDVHTPGNTHNIFWTKFSLNSRSSVTINVAAVDRLEGVDVSFLDDLNPAFSVYRGLVPTSTHDGADPACNIICYGVFKALEDFTGYNDDGDAATLAYIGHSNDPFSDIFTSATFSNLEAGDYTVLIGGADTDSLLDEFFGTTMEIGFRAFVVDTNIEAVPLVGALPLMVSGLLGLAGFRKTCGA